MVVDWTAYDGLRCSLDSMRTLDSRYFGGLMVGLKKRCIQQLTCLSVLGTGG